METDMKELMDISIRASELANGIEDPRLRAGVLRSAAGIREAVGRYDRMKKRPPYVKAPHPNPVCVMHGEPLGNCMGCAEMGEKA